MFFSGQDMDFRTLKKCITRLWKCLCVSCLVYYVSDTSIQYFSRQLVTRSKMNYKTDWNRVSICLNTTNLMREFNNLSNYILATNKSQLWNSTPDVKTLIRFSTLQGSPMKAIETREFLKQGSRCLSVVITMSRYIIDVKFDEPIDISVYVSEKSNLPYSVSPEVAFTQLETNKEVRQTRITKHEVTNQPPPYSTNCLDYKILGFVDRHHAIQQCIVERAIKFPYQFTLDSNLSKEVGTDFSIADPYCFDKFKRIACVEKNFLIMNRESVESEKNYITMKTIPLVAVNDLYPKFSFGLYFVQLMGLVNTWLGFAVISFAQLSRRTISKWIGNKPTDRVFIFSHRQRRHRSRQFIDRFLNGILILVCAVGCVWQMMDIGETYFGYKVIRSAYFNLPPEPLIPSLSLCANIVTVRNRHAFSNDSICHQQFYSQQHEHLCMREMMSYNFNELAYKYTKNIEEWLDSVQLNFPTSDTLKIQSTELSNLSITNELNTFIRLREKCYRFNLKELHDQTKMASSFAAREGYMRLFLSLTKPSQKYFSIYLDELGKYPRLYSASHKFLTDVKNIAICNAYTESLLPAPYETDCVDYDEFGYESQFDCIEKCVIKHQNQIKKSDMLTVTSNMVNASIGGQIMPRVLASCRMKCSKQDCRKKTYLIELLNQFTAKGSTTQLYLDYVKTVVV